MQVEVRRYEGTIDEFAQRERDCWEYWGSLSAERKANLVRTVETEMERLAVTVENWLPASATKNNGFIDILIRLQVDEKGDPEPAVPSVDERVAELVMIEELKNILEDENE